MTVVRLPRGVTVQSPGARGQLEKVSGKASAALPGARTASWVSTGDRTFVSADGRTTFGLIYPVASFTSSNPYASALPRLERTLAGQHVQKAPVVVTGATILSSGGQGGGNSVLAETLLAGSWAALNGGAHASAACAIPFRYVRHVPEQVQRVSSQCAATLICPE